jgi:hypothetical protein
MARPILSKAVSWADFQSSVVEVFRTALLRLIARGELPRTEEPINLVLYWEAIAVHHEMARNGSGTLPFVILFDTPNQPSPDDTVRSRRLKKQPDFTCAMTDSQAHDPDRSQVCYHLECKRLGAANGSWVLNSNYTHHGIVRFIDNEWQYAKHCESATMIGYIQDQDLQTILDEVNLAISPLALPKLTAPTGGWSSAPLHTPNQGRLSRSFHARSFQLTHLWVDLRTCKFKDSLANVSPRKKKSVRRRRRPRTA